MIETAGRNVVVVSSHRAREKLSGVIGKTSGYWARIDDPNDYHVIPDDKLPDVLRIKSIRLCKRPPAALYERISFS